MEMDYSLYTKDMHYISHSFLNTRKARVEAIQMFRFKFNQLRVTREDCVLTSLYVL